MKAHHGSLSREKRLRDRGRPQVRSPEGPGRHLQPRARHRHGRGRPRGPGVLAGRACPPGCSASAGPATRSGRRAAGRSSRSTGPTCSRPRSWSSACRPARSRRPTTRATRSTCCASRSWRCARSTTGRSTSSPRSCAARPRSPTCPTRCSPRCSTCCRAATRPRSSPSCGPASCGTASPACVRGRAGAQRLAVTNPGTIPDRGLFTVTLPDGTRVGELDEEMVYESRPGETFLLGASTWRIEEITFQKVIVTPAPGLPGKMPFWHGDGPGRPLELGRAMGAFTRELRARQGQRRGPGARLRGVGPRRAGRRQPRRLPRRAGRGHRRGARRPHDRGRALPRRDRRLAGVRAVAVRRPGARAVGDGAAAPAGRAVGHGRRADVERRRHRHPPARVGRRAARRGAAARPRRGRRDPHGAAAVHRRCSPAASASAPGGRCCCRSAGPTSARRCGSSASAPPTCCRWPASTRRSRSSSRPPASASTTSSTCPRWSRCCATSAAARCASCPVDTRQASPFAQSLLFGWIAVYMYEGDAPLAERRAAALALDRDLLPRPARGRGAPRAHRRRRARRARARAAAPRARSPGARLRRAARPAAPARPAVARRAGRPRRRPAGRGRLGRPAGRRAARVRGPHRGRGAGRRRRGRRPPARRARAWPCRSACRRSAPSRCPRPLLDLVARYARTHGPFLTAARRRPLRRRRRARCAPRSRRSIGRGPGGAGRVPARRRRARVVRRRRAAPAAAPVAGRAAPRGGAGRRRHPGPLPARAGTASARGARGARRAGGGRRPAAGRAAGGLGARPRRARRPPPDRRGRPTSTRCAPRARSCGWGPASIGSRDGRIRLAFRDQAGLLLPDGRGRWRSPSPLHTRAARPPRRAGRVVLGRPHPGRPGRRPALRRPDRARRAVGPRLGGARHQRLAGPAAGLRRRHRPPRRRASRPPRGRPRPGRLARLGPPAGAGRWSLVAPLLEPRPTATEAAHARALQLLERYGVLTREAALGEGAEGGFAGVYPVLKALEERGQVRRGYFVAGLGAAQFAVPGAVDRLRGRAGGRAGRRRGEPARRARRHRPGPAVRRGAALAGQPTAAAAGRRRARGPGRRARPLAYLERGAHRSCASPAAVDDDRWAAALGGLVDSGRFRSLELRHDRRRRRCTRPARGAHRARAGRLQARVQGLDPAAGPWLSSTPTRSTPSWRRLDTAMVVVTVAAEGAGGEVDGCLVGFHSQSSHRPAPLRGVAVGRRTAPSGWPPSWPPRTSPCTSCRPATTTWPSGSAGTTGDDPASTSWPACPGRPARAARRSSMRCPSGSWAGSSSACDVAGGDHVGFVLEPEVAEVRAGAAEAPLRLGRTGDIDPGHPA